MLIRLLTDRDAPEEAVAADPINIAPEYPDQGTSARRRPTSRKRACYVACVLLAKQENRLCALPREPPAPSRGSASTNGNMWMAMLIGASASSGYSEQACQN